MQNTLIPYFSILGIEATDDIRIIKKAYAQKIRSIDPQKDIETFQAIRNALTQLQRAIEKNDNSNIELEGIENEFNKVSFSYQPERKSTLDEEINKTKKINFSSTYSHLENDSTTNTNTNNNHNVKRNHIDDAQFEEETNKNKKINFNNTYSHLENDSTTNTNTSNHQNLNENHSDDTQFEVDNEIFMYNFNTKQNHNLDSIQKELVERHGVEFEDIDYVNKPKRRYIPIKERPQREKNRQEIARIIELLNVTYTDLTMRYDSNAWNEVFKKLANKDFFDDECQYLQDAFRTFFSTRPFLDRRIFEMLQHSLYRKYTPTEWDDFVVYLFGKPQDPRAWLYVQNLHAEQFWHFPYEDTRQLYFAGKQSSESANILLCALMELELSYRTKSFRSDLLKLFDEHFDQLCRAPLAATELILATFASGQEALATTWLNRISSGLEPDPSDAIAKVKALIHQTRYDPLQELVLSPENIYDIPALAFATAYNAQVLDKQGQAFSELYESAARQTHGKIKSRYAGCFREFNDFLEFCFRKQREKIRAEAELTKAQHTTGTMDKKADGTHTEEAIPTTEKATVVENIETKIEATLYKALLRKDSETVTTCIHNVMQNKKGHSGFMVHCLNENLDFAGFGYLAKNEILTTLAQYCEAEDFFECRPEFIEELAFCILHIRPPVAQQLLSMLTEGEAEISPDQRSRIMAKRLFFDNQFFAIKAQKPAMEDCWEIHFYYVLSHALCGEVEKAKRLFVEMDRDAISISHCNLEILHGFCSALQSVIPGLEVVTEHIAGQLT